MTAARVGVLALQGAYARHLELLRELGADAVEVRLPQDLAGVDALVLPGGESTTMGKLLDSSGLRAPLAHRLASGMPAFGTCAGAILLAATIADPVANDVVPFGAIGLTVRRNAFGRQIDSFEEDLQISGLEGGPFHAVFIRAPEIVAWESDVDVLAWQNGRAVMARRAGVLVSAFHPELTADARIHELFLDTLDSPGETTT